MTDSSSDNVNLSVLLVGHAPSRPAGLEVALARSGFHVTEADDIQQAAATGAMPDIALATLSDAADVATIIDRLAYGFGPGVPLVVTLPQDAPDGILTALRAGAADAVVAPVNLGELCLRLQLRRASRRGSQSASAMLDESLQFAATLVTAQRTEDVLQRICRRVADALDLDRCAFVLTAGDNGRGRVIADESHAGMLDLDLDLARYPEIEEARRTGEPVVIRDTGTDPRFEGVRHHWRLAPPAAVPQSLITIPVKLDGDVAGVFLLRPRSARLTHAQAGLDFVAQLRQAGAAVLATTRQGTDSGSDTLATADELEDRMRQEVERSRRYALGFSLVLLEMDDPPQSGSTESRNEAEHLHRHLADLLRDTFRAPDLVARFSGNGFALLLPETGASQALGAVRRLRVRLGDEPVDGQVATITAGIAGFPNPSANDAGDVLALASAALLRARAQAGERIGVAE
ncbi:MAG TPA: diguanylate cyclase [Gemmatimonadales bacterium]|nr:diguanylate cyclase [Gemmatimonadales bacterium]